MGAAFFFFFFLRIDGNYFVYFLWFIAALLVKVRDLEFIKGHELSSKYKNESKPQIELEYQSLCIVTKYI